jgi:shikimate dehydrogenase
MTRIFGVIGCPIAHSLSPMMHAAAFEALGLDAVYTAIETPPRDLAPVLRALSLAGVDGLNVTVPLKERVTRALGRGDVTGSAWEMGAVNTLVRRACRQAGRGGRLVGYNTDVEGFRRVLSDELRCSWRGKRAVILGAGGAARAVVAGLGSCGLEAIAVANRTRARAERLARWASGVTSGVTVCAVPCERRLLSDVVRQSDLLVNATSLGLRADDPLPVAASALHRRLVVVDLAYRAPTTNLVRAARRRGALAVDGVPMLVYQGAESFRLWWHRPAPIPIMRRAVERALRSR